MNILMVVAVVVLSLLALGGAAFALAGASADRRRARVAAISKGKAGTRSAASAIDDLQKRRSNVQAVLKEIEKRQTQQKVRPTLRRRIEQAGLSISPRAYW